VGALFLPQLASIFLDKKFDTATWPFIYGTASGVVATSVASPQAKVSARIARNAAVDTMTASNSTVFCGALKYVDGSDVPHAPNSSCVSPDNLPSMYLDIPGVVHHPKWVHRDTCLEGQSYKSPHHPDHRRRMHRLQRRAIL